MAGMGHSPPRGAALGGENQTFLASSGSESGASEGGDKMVSLQPQRSVALLVTSYLHGDRALKGHLGNFVVSLGTFLRGQCLQGWCPMGLNLISEAQSRSELFVWCRVSAKSRGDEAGQKGQNCRSRGSPATCGHRRGGST